MNEETDRDFRGQKRLHQINQPFYCLSISQSVCLPICLPPYENHGPVRARAICKPVVEPSATRSAEAPKGGLLLQHCPSDALLDGLSRGRRLIAALAARAQQTQEVQVVCAEETYLEVAVGCYAQPDRYVHTVDR